MNTNTTVYRIVSDLFGGEQFATREELQAVADMFGTRLEFVGDRVVAHWTREWDDEAREYSELVAVLHEADDNDEYDSDEYDGDEATTTYRVVSPLLGGEEFATREELESVARAFGTRLEFIGDNVFAHWTREWDDEQREVTELVAVLDTDDNE